MFDHVQIKVDSLENSRAFYDAIFNALGYGVVLESAGAVGFGTSPNEMFEISQAGASAAVSKAAHVAFVANSEAVVRAFHSTALAHGAVDNGAPGLRPHYDTGYFAAFVIDPNGHNLEAVCHIRN